MNPKTSVRAPIPGKPPNLFRVISIFRHKSPRFQFISRAIPSINALVELVIAFGFCRDRYRTTYEIEIWDFCDEKSILLEKDWVFFREWELVLGFLVG